MRSDSSTTFTERARRDQIVRATVELLASGGYRGASLSAIAAAIGTSKGVVLYHFDGKDEVLARVVETVLGDAAAFMTPRVAAAQGALGKVRAYVGSNLQFLGENRTAVCALTAVLTGLPPGPDGLPAYAAAGREAVSALAALLRDGQATGEFRDFSAPLVARTVRAAIDAASDLLAVEPDLDVDAYGTELLALLEPGLLA